ncbi:hypothetical protein ACQ4PT_063434 [Festuca glaucescens]
MLLSSNTVITLEEWVIMHIPPVAACGDYAHTYGLPVGGHPVRLHLRKCTEHQFSEVQTSSRKANKIKDGCRMVMHVLGRRSKEERALSEKTKKTMLGQSMLAIVHFSLTVGSSLMLFMEAKLYTKKKRGC